MTSASAFAALPDALVDVAESIFGAAMPSTVRYVEQLAEVATVRGLLGPREVARLWERHILNSAVLAELVPPGLHVLDVGSGAGLPGIPLALARPDLRVTLLDSMSRRTIFLSETIELLGITDRVYVRRGRVEELRASYDVVTARAVAALPVLGRWCARVTRRGGELLAVRGESAAHEVSAARAELARGGWSGVAVVNCGRALAVPTTVVRAVRT